MLSRQQRVERQPVAPTLVPKAPRAFVRAGGVREAPCSVSYGLAMQRLLLAIASGAALVLAFPAYDLWFLAPVGVAALALATRGAGVRGGAGLGMLSGLVFFVPTLNWAGSVVGLLPWFALAALQAGFVALAGGVCGWLQSATSLAGPGRVRPAVVALAWVGQEALRDRVPYGGFPWVRLAFSQADAPLGRLAALGGAPAVTFAVALCGGVLAAGVARLWQERAGSLRPVRAAVPFALALAIAVAGLAVPLPSEGPEAEVMAVQGNVPRAGLEFNAQRRQVLDNHVSATVAAAAQVASGQRPQPDLVVWPENSSDIDPVRNADAGGQITRAVETVGAPLVVGAVLEEPAPGVSNVSLLYLPGRGLVDEYVKQHPAPFAEYIPNRAFFRRFSDEVDLVRADFVAGPGPGVFRVPSRSAGQIRAGVTICFEVAYDALVREEVLRGANLLMVQTNNATFGYTNESEQQLAISRLRAIEHGRSVLHVSTVGVSALVTADGTAHQRTSLFTSAVLSGTLPLRTTFTLATLVGPWPEYVGCAVLLSLLLGQLARSRRRP